MESSLVTFIDTLPFCRSKETSGDEQNRSDRNPTYRQCLVSALLAHEILGIDIYAEKMLLDSGYEGYHYFNKFIHQGQIHDLRLCEQQFLYEKIINTFSERRLTPEAIKVMFDMYPGIQTKYLLLKKTYIQITDCL